MRCKLRGPQALLKEQFSLLQLTCLLLLPTWLHCSEDLAPYKNEVPSPAPALLPVFAAGYLQWTVAGIFEGEIHVTLLHIGKSENRVFFPFSSLLFLHWHCSERKALCQGILEGLVFNGWAKSYTRSPVKQNNSR